MNARPENKDGRSNAQGSPFYTPDAMACLTSGISRGVQGLVMPSAACRVRPSGTPERLSQGGGSPLTPIAA